MSKKRSLPRFYASSSRQYPPINILETECTPEEISWICEVFDDVARKTQSKDFIAAIHRIHDKMPEDVKKSMEVDIEYAEAEIID